MSIPTNSSGAVCPRCGYQAVVASASCPRCSSPYPTMVQAPSAPTQAIPVYPAAPAPSDPSLSYPTPAAPPQKGANGWHLVHALQSTLLLLLLAFAILLLYRHETLLSQIANDGNGMIGVERPETPIIVNQPSTTIVNNTPGAAGSRANHSPAMYDYSNSYFTQTIVSSLSRGYRYLFVPMGAGTGFEQPQSDDTRFLIGDGGFGTPNGGCLASNPGMVKTVWPPSTDLLLRRVFMLPDRARNLQVKLAVGNDFQVYLNGVDISRGLTLYNDCAYRYNVTLDVPNEVLHGGANVLAIRSRFHGIESYLDLQITAQFPV